MVEREQLLVPSLPRSSDDHALALEVWFHRFVLLEGLLRQYELQNLIKFLPTPFRLDSR